MFYGNFEYKSKDFFELSVFPHNHVLRKLSLSAFLTLKARLTFHTTMFYGNLQCPNS